MYICNEDWSASLARDTPSWYETVIKKSRSVVEVHGEVVTKPTQTCVNLTSFFIADQLPHKHFNTHFGLTRVGPHFFEKKKTGEKLKKTGLGPLLRVPNDATTGPDARVDTGGRKCSLPPANQMLGNGAHSFHVLPPGSSRCAL